MLRYVTQIRNKIDELDKNQNFIFMIFVKQFQKIYDKEKNIKIRKLDKTYT